MLPLDHAQEIARALRARPGRPPFSIAIVDRGDQLKLLVVDDGCARLRPQIAHRKASSAVALGFATRTLATFWQAQPQVMDALWRMQPDLAAIPGGVLIAVREGSLLGAVGVSGATPDEDDQWAREAIATAGLVAVDR